VTRLAFLSPDRCSPEVRLASPLADTDLDGLVTELPQLRTLEIRGEVEAFEPDAGETLLPLAPGRALLVSEGSALPALERIAQAGYRVYDLSAGLTALEFQGADLLARLTDLDPEMLPTTGSIARGTPALIEARGEGRFRLYVSRELARFVAEVTVDLARGLGR
jgi:sarcosine oxidase gamma subunit